MKTPLINLKEIDDLFIVSISNGHFLSTGSFVGYDIYGNGYFAHFSFVEKHNNKFITLKESLSSYFVLVEKEIWGAKWDNSENICIKFISDSKLECKHFKENLFYRKIIKYSLQKMELSTLEAINIDSLNIKNPYSNEINILRKLLIDLNNKLD